MKIVFLILSIIAATVPAISISSVQAAEDEVVDKTVKQFIDEPKADSIYDVGSKYKETEPYWDQRGKELPTNVMPSFDNPTPTISSDK